MRTFVLVRDEDVSEVSGTGLVAEGVEFSDGTAVLHWCVPDKPMSTVVHENMDAVVQVHGHNGATRVLYDREA